MTTQFISRVERRPITNPSSYDDSIGPGSYEQPNSIRKSLPGFAPFATTSKRTSLVNQSDLDSPAPGLYSTFENLVKKTSSSASAFKSKSNRFDDRNSKSSGASAEGILYTLKSDFDAIVMKNQSHRPVKKPVASTILDMIKSSSTEPIIPSIPTKGQSYGYEEDIEIGRLIPQYPLQSGFSGLKNDTVGPLDYNPKIDFAKYHNPPKVSFGKDKTGFLDDTLRHAKSMPAPGAYNTQSSFDIYDVKKTKDADFLSRLHASKKHQSSSFESKTIRDPMKPRSDLPGPGSYNIPSAIQVPQPPPPDKQFFNSYGPRFKDATSRSMTLHTAPGQYNPIVSDFDASKIKIMKKKRMLSHSDWAQQVAFTSTETRFHDISAKDINTIPGPCYYQPKVNIADRIPKPNRHNRPFGSTSERFREDADIDRRSNTNDEIAAKMFEREYNIQSPTTNSHQNDSRRLPLKLKYTSAFASNDQRFRTSADEPLGPPPTAYDKQPVWTEQKMGGYRMKTKSVESRKENDPSPGPAQYHIPGAMGETKTFNRKKIFFGSSKREEKFNTDIPPPGRYNISTSLIRPTHNILLSDRYE